MLEKILLYDIFIEKFISKTSWWNFRNKREIFYSKVKQPSTYVRGFNPMQASIVLSLLFPGTARTSLSTFHPSPNLIILKEDLGTISIPGLTSAEFKQVVLKDVCIEGR